MKTPKVKTVSLGHLPDNATFHIPGLTDLYRNLRMERAGEGGCRVTGKEREGTEEEGYHWKTLASYMAYSTQVVEGNAPEAPTIEKVVESAPKVKTPKAPCQPAPQSNAPGKRGRKAKSINFVWPKGEFTVTDVATASKCEKYDVANYLIKHPEAVVRVGERKGGRGKPQVIYKLA